MSPYLSIISENKSVKSEHREGEEKEGKLEEKVKSKTEVVKPFSVRFGRKRMQEPNGRTESQPVCGIATRNITQNQG